MMIVQTASVYRLDQSIEHYGDPDEGFRVVVVARGFEEPTEERDMLSDRLLALVHRPRVCQVEISWDAANHITGQSMGNREARQVSTCIEAILNRHLARVDRDILMCQDELIDAGFAGVARL